MEPRQPHIATVQNMDAHHRLVAAAMVAALVGIGLSGHASLMPHVFITLDSFSFVILVLAWLRMLSANPQEVRKSAKLQDSSRKVIFVFVVISAIASLLAVGFLLGTAKGLSKEKVSEHVLLGLGTVVIAWFLVHTMFTLRYAHLYYGMTDPKSRKHDQGVLFPRENNPDFLDFAYFSFVIGMTCQVSDVGISSRAIRRLALVHGLVTFVFNTAILAFSFNIVSGLLQ